MACRTPRPVSLQAHAARPRPRPYAALLAGLLVGVATGLALSAGGIGAAPSAAGNTPPPGAMAAPAPPALTVTATAPRPVVWPVTFTAYGAIAAVEEASVGAQIGGYRLVDVGVNVGDHVSRGQVLARFDAALLRAEEAQLTAGHDQAEADRRRARALERRGNISEKDLLDYDTRARITAAQLAAKRLQLDHTEVVAPDDGVISARTATLGAVVPVGQELFRLIRRGRLEWRGELTAAQLARVAPGRSVVLALPDGSSATATVRRIAPALEDRSRLGIVYADIEPGGSARAGMYAEGRVSDGRRPALAVPAQSVVIRDGRTYVAALDGAAATPTVSLREVTTGRHRGDEVEIVAGVSEGDRLVVRGAGFLDDGDTVRIAEPTAAGTIAERKDPLP
ncbi:efflux RND transporter periplasmic adaptor subunit [Azospirillum halopraeferens]|uniref:efflux RND transporter periplasmic adaptor subunit n=1 Tax=Azospirillum halopraeferens TaxID=34010 RepID=UPI0003FC07ED|nr:efflux RND transporter periplasmic adaptor subunit [Azospirillum halopraeferens]